LVLGWFETNPVETKELELQISSLQTSVNNLESVVNNKPDYFEVYTIAQVDQKIANAISNNTQLIRKIFNSLIEAQNFITTITNPESYIYMIPNINQKSNDKYLEYLYIDGTLELIGS
jgi:hypothetical protein